MTETAHRIGITRPLLLVLALLASVAPFSTDLYLSAFPLMADDLGVSATSIQLTLTSFLGGLAAGQLVFGPVSDRLGRRRPLLAGAVLFVVASVGAVLAPTIELLIALRFVQGLAGAAGMVLGRAVIADLEHGKAAARAFSLMMIVGGIAPVIAPLAGSLILDLAGWRAVLAVLVVLALVMLVGAWFIVPESLPPHRRGAQRSGGGAAALLSRKFLSPAATFVLAFSAMMAYISASPFLYQEVMGLDAVTYGALFGMNALGLAAGSVAATRLLRVLSTEKVLGLGVAGVVIGAVATLVVSAAGAPVGWLVLTIFIAVGSLGGVMGPATALALQAVPGAVGSASAVLGAAQFGFAAVVSPLVGLAGEQSTLPLGVVMAACALLAAGAYFTRRTRSVGQPGRVKGS